MAFSFKEFRFSPSSQMRTHSEAENAFVFQRKCSRETGPADVAQALDTKNFTLALYCGDATDFRPGLQLVAKAARSPRTP
jgi:hypothetical protein